MKISGLVDIEYTFDEVNKLEIFESIKYGYKVVFNCDIVYALLENEES